MNRRIAEVVPMFHIHGLFGILLYFVPTLIASARHLPARGAIFVVNLLLGWTFIGWVAALIWAIVAPRPYYCYMHPQYPQYPPYPPNNYPRYYR
jgi:hypothetical protein